MMCITSDTMAKTIFIALLCLAVLSANVMMGNAMNAMREGAGYDTMMRSIVSAEKNVHLVRRSAQGAGGGMGGMGGVGGRFGFGFSAGAEAGMGGKAEEQK